MLLYPRMGAAALAGAAVLTLGGCSKAGDSGTPHAGAASAAASAPSFTYPETDYFEQAAGKAGGTLRVSVATDTGNLDLHAISHTNAQWLGRILYDNLVYLDTHGNIVPWLAKSWTVSADGRTYTFHLRDDVTFSDGARFNAEAVRINLEHMRDPATKSPLAAAYIAPYADGKVLDEYTFQANLREPYTPFLSVLAQSWLSMESPRAIQENPAALSEHPVGSGPFVVESYVRQRGIRLVKRKDYNWAPPFIRHAGAAYLDRIEVDFVPEAMVRYNSLAAGQYDFTIDAPPQNAAALRADPALRFDSRIREGNPMRGIAFNTSKEPFDDLRVRKAVAHAIDRDAIARIMGFGEFRPKADFLAENTAYYDSAYGGVLDYDPAKANRLLDEAGWTGRDAAGYRTKNGKRLSAQVLFTELTGTAAPLLVAIQSDVKKVGVELLLLEIPTAQLLARRGANEYQATLGGVWHTNTPDGLYILYHSNEIISERRIGQNVSRLRDAPLDELLAAARKASDPAGLQDLYSKAQRRLTEVVPATPLYDNYTLIAYKSDVKGIVFDTSHNTVVFTTVWLQR